jgi:hypothetical protein
MAIEVKLNLWWLSFCDPHRPDGAQFLGACIVGGLDIATAAMSAHALGCNPGGEVMGVEMPEEFARHVGVAWCGRLLSKAEIARFDAEMKAFEPS